MTASNIYSYLFVPLGSVLGATIFQDIVHTMLLSIFGAVIGFLVRAVLDHYYEKLKAEKAAKLKNKNGKAD